MIIQVDPSLLQSNAQQIQEIGGNITSSVKGLVSKSQSAPSYNGQFGPQVAAIGQDAYSRANNLAGSITNLGERLFAKAIEFDAADNASIAGVETVFDENQLLSFWSKLFGIPIDKLERYLKLGIILGISGLFSLPASIFIGTRIPVNTPPISTPIPSPQPPISVSERQDNTDWADKPMGEGGTMAEYGCTVTCLTMLARYYGVDITPQDFNTYLRDNKGYVKGSNLYWDKAKDYLNSKLSIKGNFSTISGVDAINAKLNAGFPVILHIKGATTDGHYVLAVPPPGKNGVISVFDPLKDGQQTCSISQVEGATVFQ